MNQVSEVVPVEVSVGDEKATMSVRSIVVDGERFFKKMVYRSEYSDDCDPYSFAYIPENIWNNTDLSVEFKKNTAIVAVSNKEEAMEERTQTKDPETCGFDKALQELKKGCRVARNGWNGKGMWLEMSEYEPTSMYKQYPLQQHILMKTAQDTYVPWLASQTDLVAEDWFCF